MTLNVSQMLPLGSSVAVPVKTCPSVDGLLSNAHTARPAATSATTSAATETMKPLEDPECSAMRARVTAYGFFDRPRRACGASAMRIVRAYVGKGSPQQRTGRPDGLSARVRALTDQVHESAGQTHCPGHTGSGEDQASRPQIGKVLRDRG